MERLRAVFGIAMPSGKASRQCRAASHLDRSGTQRVAPLDLTQMPAGERHRIVDDDDQIFLTAWVGLADLGVAPFDEQPAAAAWSRQ